MRVAREVPPRGPYGCIVEEEEDYQPAVRRHPDDLAAVVRCTPDLLPSHCPFRLDLIPSRLPAG